MGAHLIEHLTSTQHVNMHIVKGGETVSSAQHDAVIMEAWDGQYENVHLRAFGENGEVVEFRFSAADMLAALELVAELRKRGIYFNA